MTALQWLCFRDFQMSILNNGSEIKWKTAVCLLFILFQSTAPLRLRFNVPLNKDWSTPTTSTERRRENSPLQLIGCPDGGQWLTAAMTDGRPAGCEESVPSMSVVCAELQLHFAVTNKSTWWCWPWPHGEGSARNEKEKHFCQALSILAVILFYMNTCWAPHFEMSPKPFTMATLTLFSASEQIHCALVVGDWMSDCSFTQHTLNIYRSSYNAFWLLHGWCHIKLLLSWHTFCIHHTVYIIQPCASLQCHFTQRHMHRVHLAVTCHLHFWKKYWDLFHATAVTHT